MSALGVEGIADATLAYFEASAAAKITAVNERFAVELTLPTFARYSIADPEFLNLTLNDLPICCALPNDSQDDNTAGEVHRFQFAVIAFSNGENSEAPAETAKRCSLRYILAVQELLQEMHSHASSTYWVGGAPLHWGSDNQPWRKSYPILRSLGSGEFVADARLEVGLDHTEA